MQAVKPRPRPAPRSKFAGLDKASLCKLDISSPMPLNGSFAPPQSMVDGTTLRGIEISGPILQSQTNKSNNSVPVRPAPPKPNGVQSTSTTQQSVNSNKASVCRASSLNRRESGRRPRPLSGAVPSRPSAPPPCPPPPASATSTPNSTHRTNVASLAQRFEKATSSNGDNKQPIRTQPSSAKLNGNLNHPKC